MSEQEQVVATDVVPVETAETPVVPSGETAKPEVAEIKQPVEEKKFTQAEVNDLLQKRLARERAKRDRELEAEVKALKEHIAPPKAEAPSNPAAPKREEFESYEDYIRADARYVAREEAKNLREEEARATKQATAQQARQAAMTEFGKRELEARQKYQDFDEALETARTLPISDDMFDAIMEEPQGWDVVHYLGTHPEEVSRIAQLSPKRQATEVGRLAERLSAQAPAPKPASVSQAPEPIDPTRPSTSMVSDKMPTNPDEYRAKRTAQRLAEAQQVKRT